MLSLASGQRIYAALGATDMRKSFDTLAEEVRRVIGEDPLSGALFVFCNRARNRIKVLVFDRGGYWLVARRLERGTFAWPKERARGRLVLRGEDLSLLLNGLDPSDFKRRDWYERAS
jgi:transposase